VAQRILKSAGHRVLSAANAEQALALSDEHAGPIDLLVSDVVMTGIDGPALSAQHARTRHGLRTLFISGYSNNHALLPDDPSTGAAFLAKPFTYDALIAKVAELLSTPRREPEAMGDSARGA
jgi:two-component system cell cycle sensor histidine kinase/response regulator CckA